MRNIAKFLIVVVVALLVSAIVFFFWAKQACVPYEDYVQIGKHNNNEAQSDSILRIFTYNIGYLSGMTNNLSVSNDEEFYNENMNAVLTRIKEANPDVIAFQEIDYNSKRSYYIDQNKKIADELFAYSATTVNWDKKYVPFPYWPIRVNFGRMLSGQSVVSNYRIVDNQRIVLQKAESNPYYYNSFYLDRLAQVVTIKHPVKDITIINIHAEAFDQATRIAQLKDVLQLARSKADYGPVILLGDFNSDPKYKNAACRLFFEDNIFACADQFGETDYEKTYPSGKPTERLDYIFYTKKDFIALESGVLEQFGVVSDHFPVFANLKFR